MNRKDLQRIKENLISPSWYNKPKDNNMPPNIGDIIVIHVSIEFAELTNMLNWKVESPSEINALGKAVTISGDFAGQNSNGDMWIKLDIKEEIKKDMGNTRMEVMIPRESIIFIAANLSVEAQKSFGL